MRVLSLFAGVGGFDLGLAQAGHEVVGQVEIDPFARRVLAARWPGVWRDEDVRDVGVRRLQPSRDGADHAHTECGRTFGLPIDLLSGGFPCQDLSVAGKRAGLAGARSSLFHEIVRIAHACRPTWGLFENVPGLVTSHAGRDLWTVLQGLRECWPVVGWRILDSQHFGVPQRRRRVFLVGGPSEVGVAQVLALGAGRDGDSPAGGKAWAGAAGDAAWSTSGAGWWRNGVGTVSARTWKDGQDVGLVAHTLRSEGSEDGTGRGVPLVVEMAHHGANQTEIRTGTTYPVTATQAVARAGTVRRLTPVECERLQGFPDGWTCLCLPLAAYADDPDAAALICRCPDSPRYRAMGNAVTVPVVAWLGRRFPSG